MKEASSLARNAATLAISSGRAYRFISCRPVRSFMAASLSAKLSRCRSAIGVATPPGQITLTLISGANSTAAVLVRPMTADFEAP
jgi:hypothetical protein